MARPARERHRGKRAPYLLLYISIKAAKARKKPATSKGISKKHSKPWKPASRAEGRKQEEMVKHRETRRPKERRSGPASGGRRRQRKRANITRAKQPLPAFFLFMAQHRPQLQKSNPRWTAVETVKKLGKMWHSQPEEDKEMYKEQARRLRRNIQKRKA